jgi:hypothetical protein
MPKLSSFFFCCMPKKEENNLNVKFSNNYSIKKNSKKNNIKNNKIKNEKNKNQNVIENDREIKEEKPPYHSYDCYYDPEKDCYYNDI